MKLWFNLQQRNWQLGVTTRAGAVPCDKSLGLNKTTSCHFSTNRSLTSDQHHRAGQLQMYSTMHSTCSFNATISHYYFTLWTLCWLPGIKTLEKAQLPPHQLKRRWSECCFPHQLDKIINHPRSTAINYLFFLYLLFGTPFFSVLRFENIKSGNCYFWVNLSKKNSQGTLQCRNIINGTKPSQVALREVIIMQESCRLKCA